MNQAQYKSHSFYLTDSLLPLNPYHNRRQDGGLLLLVSPALKNQCSISYKSRFSLVVTIQPSNKKIAFVYFPPSLDDQIIKTELSKTIHFINLWDQMEFILLSSMYYQDQINLNSLFLPFFNSLQQPLSFQVAGAPVIYIYL
jgi:hypothetical protein